MDRTIGLLGIASYLPPQVRGNDWWPAATVERWLAARRAVAPGPPPDAPTPAMQRVLAAMAQHAVDPFGGVTERRVLADDQIALDMEVAAAEQAIANAGVARGEIDLLLTHSATPEYLMSNTACVLHRRLGLPPACFTMQAEASAYSFMAQLTVAEQMISTGRVRHALLVQSCVNSRVLDREDPTSPVLGDGAAAVVVGRTPGAGLLAAVHRTDGTNPRALIATVPGGRWYDAGQVVVHSADPRAARTIFLETADRANEVVSLALAEAGHAPGEVDFFAVHQGTPWLRRVTQETIGLTRARSVDTFSTTGYLFGASIPLVLETAQRRGQLARGDLVVLHGGGVGSTYGAAVLRWGDAVA